MDISIRYNRTPNGGSPIQWEGSISEIAADSSAKRIVYTKNDPQYISFDGSYVIKNEGQTVLQYSYNLPVLENGVPSSARTEKEGTLAMEMSPTITQPLAIGNKKDIKGHWAEDSIKKMLALGVFRDDSDYFGPALPIKRGDFAKAIAIVAGINIDQSNDNVPAYLRNRNKTPETSPFFDVSVNSADYKYIKAVVQNGLMEGTSNSTFSPAQSLTREQAIVIAIRALGLESLAPTAGYNTTFADDDKISPWAKDSVYVAYLIGLIQGDEYNRFNPQQAMTKAEVSVFLDRFIQFLQKDMIKNYVDRVLNF
ncbi:S-layer homology domain-containing protein [Caldanaerobius fijiensis DSM 17918]|uniref:S-layer homology domain-containing protein n=1 Tax=Caldanaerobius fijiensis DSM 17918 TaxID=1121256 RepID=A0A1M4URP9_9THEO|nr:S-layer homology domain-containing protein [Caldanaerobius fijiensis]SHE59338.1 S-layer homology domain-containing protein [Caldanaerobius fijiensis DSM 17918]